MKKVSLMLLGAALAPMLIGFSLLNGGKTFSPKLDPFLIHDLTQNGEGPALVILKEQADISFVDKIIVGTGEKVRNIRGAIVYKELTDVAQTTQQELMLWLDNRNVGYKRFYAINAIYVYKSDIKTYVELAKLDSVDRIVANPSVAMKEPEKEPTESLSSGVEGSIVSIGAKRVWDELGVTGQGITVSGQDTGIQWDHPALIKQYRGTVDLGPVVTADHNYNWHDAIHKKAGTSEENPCGYDIEAPCDDHNHGTHSLGTVVGSDGGENQIGVAPGADWIGCRNMDSGDGTPATYIECFEFFLAPYPHGGDSMTDGRPELAPHVMNNSWGCPPSEGCHADEMLPVINALKVAGVFVVASAGNEGPSCETINDPPAWHSGITFSVGAMNHRDGKIASFSSRGPSKFDGAIGPDIAAPGVNIRSAVTGGEYEGGWSGTSMAGPHIAGVVALMWSANEKLIGDIETTSKLLTSTAKPTTTTDRCGSDTVESVPNNTFGHGIVDAFAAVQAATNLK